MPRKDKRSQYVSAVKELKDAKDKIFHVGRLNRRQRIDAVAQKEVKDWDETKIKDHQAGPPPPHLSWPFRALPTLTGRCIATGYFYLW